jgi:hypothetical protein
MGPLRNPPLSSPFDGGTNRGLQSQLSAGAGVPLVGRQRSIWCAFAFLRHEAECERDRESL